MVGTILNVLGILIGGMAGLMRGRPLPPATEAYFQFILAAFTMFYGLRLTWVSLHGTFLQMLRQVALVILAMMLGKLLGRLLYLQKLSNRLGQRARERLQHLPAADRDRFNEGFQTCAALFCAAPLGILGAAQDGLSQYFYPLAVKAVMDGLATMGFVLLFGSGALLAALPVLVFQGTIFLCARALAPFLGAHGLIDPVNAVGGLLVFSVSLVMLGLKRIELADYLPSLALAPVLTWLWR